MNYLYNYLYDRIESQLNSSYQHQLEAPTDKLKEVPLLTKALFLWYIEKATTTDTVKEVPLPENQFIKRIEQKIDSLGKLPDSKFCKDYYEEVAYHLDSYYKEKRLGITPSENDQWKEKLTKSLYDTYANKFIQQAFHVFSKPEWEIDDLTFIHSEYQALRQSKLLEEDSSTDRNFTEIQTVFSKYDEITGFISTCKGFSYSASGLSNRFPVSDVQNKISRSKTYLNNRLGNDYVNNCTRLRDELKEIPQSLFWAHVRYLNNKITQWSGLYSNYNSFNDYNNNLGRLIQSEIDALDNSIYNVTHFDNEHKKLSDKWNADKKAANEYKYP